LVENTGEVHQQVDLSACRIPLGSGACAGEKSAPATDVMVYNPNPKEYNDDGSLKKSSTWQRAHQTSDLVLTTKSFRTIEPKENVSIIFSGDKASNDKYLARPKLEFTTNDRQSVKKGQCVLTFDDGKSRPITPHTELNLRQSDEIRVSNHWLGPNLRYYEVEIQNERVGRMFCDQSIANSRENMRYFFSRYFHLTSAD